MLRFALAVAVGTFFATQAGADVIKPIDVKATSMFGAGLYPQHLINGDQGPEVGLPHFGLLEDGGPGVLDDKHDFTISGNNDTSWGWINGCADGGIDGGTPAEGCSDLFNVKPISEEAQVLEFEFDGAYNLSAVHIWNENTDGFAPDRGVDEFELQVSSSRTGDSFTAVGTTYNLTAPEPGSITEANSAQVTPLVANGIRRVRMIINSNHFEGDGEEEEYVGLAEVRFEGTRVTQDLAAEADKDDDVDGNDFLHWQRNVGLGEIDTTFFRTTLIATQSRGDFTNNNVVRGDDLAVWASEFGQGVPLGAAVQGVPEPSTLLLGLIAAVGALLDVALRLLG